VWTIVVAAGASERFGEPKQYADLAGRRVLDWSVTTARSAGEGVVVVLPAADAGAPGTVAGGPTRTASVRNGLAAVPQEAEVVCVHDAARPFATRELFAAVVAAVRAGADGAIPAVPVTDTIKVVDADGVVASTLERAALVAVQTPQAFRADVLRRAHDAGAEGTDDASLVEAIGGRVVTVPGLLANRKLTHRDDLEWARRRLAAPGGEDCA
jgi:2-C-methyl-D-erythritol 4-phosphate cytidylyltransferase